MKRVKSTFNLKGNSKSNLCLTVQMENAKFLICQNYFLAYRGTFYYLVLQEKNVFIFPLNHS